MQAVVDGTTLYADFGNALPTTTPGSDLAGIGEMAIGWVDANANFTGIGALAGYTAAGWYEQTAGVQAFPLNGAPVAANRRTSCNSPSATARTPARDGCSRRRRRRVRIPYRLQQNRSTA